MQEQGIKKRIKLDGAPNAYQVMSEIIRDMREIPELPSEVPQDQQSLLEVAYPEEGGMLTYMSGHDYAYRGFPFFEIVEKIDVIKKITRGSLSGLFHSLKRTNKLWLLTLIPSLWILRNFVASAIYTFHRLVERTKVKETHLSRAVRELYRSFDPSELGRQVRDIVCMILEFDNAYRFRAQDVLVELDKDALRKNPIKELLRLLDVMISRENTQEIRDTWRLASMGVSLYLRLDSKLRNVFVDALLRLDLEKFSLTDEDKNFCSIRKDYSFKFKENPSANDAKVIFLAEVGYNRSKDLANIRKECVHEQITLQERHKLEQEKLVVQSTEEENKVLADWITEEMSKLNSEYDQRKNAILQNHLTQEQKDTLARQRDEMNTIALKYEHLLKDMDESYSVKKINYLNAN